MKLSVILITYDMAREIPRTLQGLSRPYQRDAQNLDYEVVLVDNGSPVPLDAATWEHIDVPVRLIQLYDASPSPARAINIGLNEACGEIVCLMIDGAHLLTPGVFRLALGSIGMLGDALVATRYFWLGPDEQNESIQHGYSQQFEDLLLHYIRWPDDGYRLYEIGVPLTAGAEKITWFNRMFESNCLFMNRTLFDRIGGADESFVLPGGGMINSDIYKRAADLPGVTPVQLIGEGSFHQLHGGTTTNVSPQERDARVDRFMAEYRELRGHDQLMSDKKFHFVGHLPTEASKIHRQDRKALHKSMDFVRARSSTSTTLPTLYPPVQEHRTLARLQGDWLCEGEIYLSPEQPSLVHARMVNRVILGGLYIESSTMHETSEASRVIYGYDPDDGRFVAFAINARNPRSDIEYGHYDNKADELRFSCVEYVGVKRQAVRFERIIAFLSENEFTMHIIYPELEPHRQVGMAVRVRRA